MINSKILYQCFRVWILPVFLLLAGAATFFYWAESQMRVPGGLRDIEYWQAAMLSTNAAGDLKPLSGYLHQRVAEMVAEPKHNRESVFIFGFMDRILQEAKPLRKISDLKYALLVYKQQLFLAAPSALRLYFSIRHLLGADKLNGDMGQDLISESDLRLEKLVHLKEIEKIGGLPALRAFFEKMLVSPEFSHFQAPVMLDLAFFLYEKDPSEASRLIDRLNKKKPNYAVRHAAAYLRNKLIQKRALDEKHFKSSELEIENLFKMGLFERTAQRLNVGKSPLFSKQMQAMQSWLGLGGSLVSSDKQSLLAIYYGILSEALKDPSAASDQLVKLAEDNNSAAYSALLRYQAWSLAYFDAKSYSRAFFIAEFLKLSDPLSPYSQLELVKGMFRLSSKSFTGSKLLQAWQEEPYRFDMIRKDNWGGFKEGKNRKSEITVHEGRVYVVKYNESGQAEILQEVGAGERVSDQRAGEEDLKEPVKMGWMDQFFYSAMMKFIPLGIRTFKEQIAKPAQNLKKSVFTRLYKQEEFQVFVLDKIRPSLGGAVQAMQAQINEQGFSIYSVFNLKLVTLAVSGLGKLKANEDGRLILKLDHVRVAKVYLPKWLLKRVEKSFNLSANSEGASETAQIDILDMQYQSGGILIRCRKKSFQATTIV